MEPPTWPLCKLNTDGATKRTGESSAGGLIRDHNGKWLAGFCMNIGSCSVTVAELWGLRQGLLVAWHKGIRWLHMEVESLSVVKLVDNCVVLTNEYTPLVYSIKDLLGRDCHINITHVYREAKLCSIFPCKLCPFSTYP